MMGGQAPRATALLWDGEDLNLAAVWREEFQKPRAGTFPLITSHVPHRCGAVN